jgi:hypothetical protein
MKLRIAGLGLALSTATLAHAVDDAAFARCRGIADTAARLACYDGLPVTPAAAPTQSPPIAPSRPAPGATTPAPRAAAPAPTPQAQAAKDFGMEERAAAAQALPGTLESTIPGRFEGWGPNSRFRLANGQVWQVVDNSSAVVYRDNPKVVVRRGMMGGFFLEIEDSNRSPRVRRIQ